MDGVDETVLQDFTSIKRKNSGLKTIVSIGGWTFSDNGTATQPLFGEICSSAANRAKFIGNLLDFMRQYAFDGVDFDWGELSARQKCRLKTLTYTRIPRCY